MTEMEHDSERAALLLQIAELLLSGGYFRAQISTLSPFDMLTGGLAWAIAASNVDVDFDVLYDDDATLGYKIKVGEAIEEALDRMMCPYPLQAHQIQGLDYPAVLLVVEWLVKGVLQNREESGDQLRKYSLWKFHQHYEVPGEEAHLDRLRFPRQSDSADKTSDPLLDLKLNDVVDGGSFLDQQTAALEKQMEFQKARMEQLQVKKDLAVSAAEEIDVSLREQEGRRSIGQSWSQREQKCKMRVQTQWLRT